MLEYEDIQVNCIDDNRRPALYYAVKNGHTSIVKLLLAMKGIDVQVYMLREG